MILVLGGTSDAREMALALQGAGYAVLLTTVTPYAGALAEGIEVRVGALDREALAELAGTATAVIDATHPFAAAISEMAITVCSELNVPYLRYERAGSSLPEGVHAAGNAGESAEMAVRLAAGGVIFLTVGSKTLATYVAAVRAAGCGIVARVLPVAESLAACDAAGLQPREILAMQGPTTAELDAALLRFYGAAVLVTKESGPAGGVEEKLAAARAVGIPAVVVRRPALDYPRVARSVEEVLAHVTA